MKWWVLLAFLFVLATCGANVRVHAKGVSAPLPYSCATVRWAVTHFTPEHLEAMAKTMGIVITARHRQQVAECMKGG